MWASISPSGMSLPQNWHFNIGPEALEGAGGEAMGFVYESLYWVLAGLAPVRLAY